MANVTVKTRIVNKHDTTANWNARSTFIPKAGEIIIYTDTHKVKVGDGTSTISSLPFIDNVDLSNYVTDSELASHTSNTSNPHKVTKAQVGLSSVVNAGQTATPSSGSNSYFTAGGAYTLQQAINGKANDSEVVKKNSSMGSGNWNTNTPYIVGGQIDTHPENNGTLLTYMMNDLAFMLSRGGSCVLKNTTNKKTLSTNIDRLFNCTADYMSLNGLLDSQSDVIEIIIKTPSTFSYSNKFGIGFGSAAWRAKNVKIEAGYSVTNKGSASSPDTDIKWKTVINITNSNAGVVNVNSSGPGTAEGGIAANTWSYLRYTLTNWANINPRIAQVWIQNYSSSGLAAGYVSRAGGSIYGNLNVNGYIQQDAMSLSNQDLNNYGNGYEGRYFYSGGGNTCANKPDKVDSFGFTVMRTASGVYSQLLIGQDPSKDNMSRVFVRRNYNGWQDWRELTNSSDSLAELRYEDLGEI